MRVTFFHRLPQDVHFSVERLFADVRRVLPESMHARVAVCRFPSRGIWRRIYNIVEAAFREGDINHITGDVHFLSLLLHKRRTLLTILDLVSVHRVSGWRKACLLFFWYWLPIKRSAVVSVISNFTKQDLLRHIKVDPEKVQVVYCPVSEAFKPFAREFNAVKPVVLQVGTTPNKNIKRLAEALHGISCCLRVIGNLDASTEALLQSYGIDYSNVSNIAFEEIIDEYHRCDMVVFASTFEGFGLPILEAQATGRPVVTGNIMSMPEVAGDAACLVDPFSVESIREGILKIIHDPAYRQRLVQSGFKNIERFRLERIAQEYATIYKLLAEGHWT
jgi:glycosyltransferase involved in cell wall biosynthesis